MAYHVKNIVCLATLRQRQRERQRTLSQTDLSLAEESPRGAEAISREALNKALCKNLRRGRLKEGEDGPDATFDFTHIADSVREKRARVSICRGFHLPETELKKGWSSRRVYTLCHSWTSQSIKCLGMDTFPLSAQPSDFTPPCCPHG